MESYHGPILHQELRAIQLNLLEKEVWQFKWFLDLIWIEVILIFIGKIIGLLILIGLDSQLPQLSEQLHLSKTAIIVLSIPAYIDLLILL